MMHHNLMRLSNAEETSYNILPYFGSFIIEFLEKTTASNENLKRDYIFTPSMGTEFGEDDG